MTPDPPAPGAAGSASPGSVEEAIADAMRRIQSELASSTVAIQTWFAGLSFVKLVGDGQGFLTLTFHDPNRRLGYIMVCRASDIGPDVYIGLMGRTLHVLESGSLVESVYVLTAAATDGS